MNITIQALIIATFTSVIYAEDSDFTIRSVTDPLLKITTSSTLLPEKDDKWLEEKVTSGIKEFNTHYFWFHVFEDEINHRGQINFLKKRLGK